MVIICLWISDCLDAVEWFDLLIEITNHCISLRRGASQKLKFTQQQLLFYSMIK